MALARQAVQQPVDETEYAATEGRGFEPARHIVRLRGGDYLEVKWRLLWLRTEHPNALIETEMVHFDPENKMAVFKARITLPESGSATGWGSETSDDFKDFIEKAETKAIGRACAALGFGTQFCQDYDYDNQGSGRVVDAPVSYPSANGNGFSRSAAPSNGNSNGGGSGLISGGAASGVPSQLTEKQLKFIYGTGKDQGLNEEQVIARCKEKFGVTPEELSKSAASRFIDMLKQPA